jgi:hypothetical protein
MAAQLPKPLRGIVAPMVTPLLDRDTLDSPGLERLIRPRFTFMIAGPFWTACGIGMLVQGLALSLPLPIPGSNWVFIIPIILYGIGLLESDGLLIMVKDSNLATYGAFYLESCYIPNHTFATDAQGVIVQESVSVQFELAIPIAVQWWSVWYPGAEPGGGSYIAQRMLASKSEKDSLGAVLFFNVAHYVLRPWPWILVGLCSLIVYPQLSDILHLQT